MVAVAQPLDDLVGRLLPREVEEVLLDVLDLEGTLLERVLLDEIFVHGASDYTFLELTQRGRELTLRVRATDAEGSRADLRVGAGAHAEGAGTSLGVRDCV